MSILILAVLHRQLVTLTTRCLQTQAPRTASLGILDFIRSLSTTTNFPCESANHKHIVKMTTKFNYPEIERNDSLVETIFDKDVPDPYRHLEDPQAEVTKVFVKQQNEVTEPFLDQCPHRKRIKEILTTSQNYKKLGCPFKRGKKYYFFMNEGLQPQSVLYQQDTVDGEPRVFFDPNTLSDDGTVALSQASFSPDGEYFAYGLSYSGSDWIEIGVKNVSTGKNLDDKLTRAKFTSIEWTHDNKGFFYAQYPTHEGSTKGTETEMHENHSIFYHVLNTPQSEDVLKVSFPDHPKWHFGFEVSQDGKHFHVFPREGCQDNNWYYCKLDEFGPGDRFVLKPIYDKMHAQFEYITNNGNEVYFRTNLDAKNYRVARLNLENPAKENWKDVIANHPEDVLDWAESYTVDGKDYLLVNYMRKVVYYLELHQIDKGLVKKFTTPLGTIVKYSGRRFDNEFFFHFTSFLTPGQIFHFDLTQLESEPKLLRQAQPKNFNPDDYKIEQVFYKSKDDTEVPMFIVQRKDLVRDGQNPCILYGYGGFNIQITSTFNINRIAWIKNFKGVLAVANIRGGGELGQDWHDSGRLLNKQNCFNDFIAAGEYLIANNYTKRDRLAIEGGSNGGLLVAATSNQRPDLFGATVCHVGVLDMIRFTSFTIGHAWTSDYGDPKEKDHFDNLIKYSPYHNIPYPVERYPATLLLTADHDDRVVPAHSLKFIAQLQHKLGKQLPDTPLLIRVDTKAGHGSGRPTSKVIDEYADIYSFLYNVLDLKEYYNES
uniref:Prolyl endopeptidase n=1 Tax=Aceria tosichella TaxID=561515 RepID=A0A6G1S5W1_9ACAR